MPNKYINSEGNLISDNTILFLQRNRYVNFEYDVSEVFEPLLGNKKRDWFPEHAYRCLPLTIANQYGLMLKSAYDFTVFWDGKDQSQVQINVDFSSNPSHKDNFPIQEFLGNFQYGIMSVLNFCSLRVSPYTNLMIIQTPNMINNPDLFVMTGVVEADNLRAPFTFNFRVLTPNKEIKVKRGDSLATVLPIPRYYVENFKLENAKKYFDDEVLDSEQHDMDLFSWERKVLDPVTKPHGSGKRYMRGLHHNGDKFVDHQPSIKVEKEE